MVNMTRGTRNKNALLMAFFIMFGLLLVFFTVTKTDPFGQLYFPIFTLIVLIYLLSESRRTRSVFEFVGVNPKGVGMQVLAGLGLGVVLTQAFLRSEGLFSVLLSPLNTPSLAILGFGGIGSVFLLSIATAELEENFRSGTLRPTFAEILKTRAGVILFTIILGLVAYFLLGTGFNIFGIPGRFIGVLLFFTSLLIITRRISAKFIQRELVRQAFSIITVGVIFALFHLAAYGASGAALTNAFLFAVIADTLNLQFRSTTPGKIAHCMNNAVIGVILLGLPVLFAIIITLIYASILYIISTGGILPKRLFSLRGIPIIGR